MKKDISSGEQGKDTGLAIVLILLLFVFLAQKEFLLLPAITTLVMAMTWPTLFSPLARLWFDFSRLLSSIVSRIVLALVFFVVATPIGVVRRLCGADTMRCNEWKRGKATAFVCRQHEFSREDLEKP